MTFLLDIARNDTEFCFIRGQNARAVRPNQAGFLAFHIAAHLDHILYRNVFGNADHQIQSGIHSFHNGVSGEPCGYIDHGGRSPCCFHCVFNGIEYGNAFYFLTGLARRYTGDNLRAVGQHLLRVEGGLFARNALYDYLCIFIY